MKVTAKTIAEELNISPATVDRVLHNRGSVSPKTIKKVLDKAGELNYTPNKSASFLSKKKNLRIAFVFPEYPEYFWKEIEIGIKRTLEDIQDYGFHVEIFKVPYKLENQLEIVKIVINSKEYDGLVICPTDDEPLTELIKSEIQLGFPIFTFNNDSPNSKRLSYVGADYYDAGRLAGELLDHFTNHSKRLAVIIDEGDTYQMKEKRRGFETYTYESNEVDFVKLFKLDNKNIACSIRELESAFKDVDGIYVACGALADVAKEISKMNLDSKPILIGHDMSNAIYEYLQKSVVTATICQDPEYQGSRAVRIAFNHLMLEKPIMHEQNIVKLEIVTKGNSKYYIQ